MNTREETSDTDEIVCPHCGHEYQDSWDANIETDCDTEIVCESCNKEFIVSAQTYIKYTSSKINCEDKDPIEEHDYKLAERGYIDLPLNNPYIYKDKNYTIYHCTKCDDEEIKTGPIAQDGKPYIIPLETKESNYGK